MSHSDGVRASWTRGRVEGVVVATARRRCLLRKGVPFLNSVGHRGRTPSGWGAFRCMEVPRRRRERGPLLIFLGFKQKGHRESVVIGRSMAQWEKLTPTGRIAQTAVRLSRSWKSGPQRYQRQVFGRLKGVVVGRALRPGRNQGKVAVVCFSVGCGVVGNQEPYNEPLKEFHPLGRSAFRKKKWPGGCGGRVELKWTEHNSPAILALRA